MKKKITMHKITKILLFAHSDSEKESTKIHTIRNVK